MEGTLEALGEGDSVGEEICDEVPCRIIADTGSELKLAKTYKAVGPQSGAVLSVKFRNTEGQGQVIEQNFICGTVPVDVDVCEVAGVVVEAEGGQVDPYILDPDTGHSHGWSYGHGDVDGSRVDFAVEGEAKIGQITGIANDDPSAGHGYYFEIIGIDDLSWCGHLH